MTYAASPSFSIHFAASPEKNSFFKTIESAADLHGRKACLIKLTLLPFQLGQATFNFAVQAIKLAGLTLILSGDYSQSLTNLYWKTLVDFSKSAIRLAVRIVQTVGYVFGYSAGLLIHPCIGRWVEKHVDRLNVLKFHSFSKDLKRFFSKQHGNPSYCHHFFGSYFSGGTFTQKAGIPEKPEKEKEGIFYEPDFSHAEDFHRILGIHPDNCKPESNITRRFKKLSLLYHPDKNPGNPDAEEKYKMITNARDKLKANPRSQTSFTSKEPLHSTDHSTTTTSLDNPPDIVMPTQGLSEEDFVKHAGKTLFEICVLSEIPQIGTQKVQDKYRDLIEAIDTYKTTHSALDLKLRKQLDEIVELIRFHETFIKDFTLSPSMLFLGRQDPSILQKQIDDLVKIKPKHLKNFKRLPENSNVALANLILSYRYYEKVSALYLLIAHHYYQQKKQSMGYYKVRDYREHVASEFFQYHKVIINTKCKDKLFQGYAQKDPSHPAPLYLSYCQFFLNDLTESARQNSRRMLTGGDFLKLMLFSKILI
ncbi:MULTISPECIES: J domain-containing protein [Parachlamydia]|jgi:hypothetical protein|uniref:J domain-containing protein n=1 Tax=Parachlamydia TaxID=83551 RepID=UPI0001C17449|nr:J domain-containing protein [Parachlamydia acanthamoebae]EFB40887.1 hypothetical protein pah_c180o080 [Parachlamydia acanthamoebae str. Hall's coccus]